MYSFRKNKFSSLSKALENPKNCEELKLQFIEYNLKNKSAIFSQFVNLRTLEIQADPSIYNLDDFELPKEIAELKKLKKISLLNLPLKVFPEWLTGIKSLQYLMIRGNDIDTIPETISKLDKLKTLRIENCELNKLPKTLNQMSNLRHLGLSDTKLTDLDPDLFPKNLKEINLSGSRRYKDDDFENLKRIMKRTKI